MILELHKGPNPYKKEDTVNKKPHVHNEECDHDDDADDEDDEDEDDIIFEYDEEAK